MTEVIEDRSYGILHVSGDDPNAADNLDLAIQYSPRKWR